MINCKIYLPVSMKLTQTYEKIIDNLFNISGYDSVYEERLYNKSLWQEYEEIINNKIHFVIDSVFNQDEIKYLRKNFKIIIYN